MLHIIPLGNVEGQSKHGYGLGSSIPIPSYRTNDIADALRVALERKLLTGEQAADCLIIQPYEGHRPMSYWRATATEVPNPQFKVQPFYDVYGA